MLVPGNNPVIALAKCDTGDGDLIIPKGVLVPSRGRFPHMHGSILMTGSDPTSTGTDGSRLGWCANAQHKFTSLGIPQAYGTILTTRSQQCAIRAKYYEQDISLMALQGLVQLPGGHLPQAYGTIPTP
jgi:hypothetical protein